MAIYYANRSFAFLKTECFGYALSDASKAIDLDKNYVKGFYRRAASNMALGKWKEALKDYEYVTKVRPSDKDAKLKYNECNKIVKKIAFEKAISVEDKKQSVADTINLDVISKYILWVFCKFNNYNFVAIENGYTGPELENGSITLNFMKELMDLYKNQGKLHRKYAYKVS